MKNLESQQAIRDARAAFVRWFVPMLAPLATIAFLVWKELAR